MRRRFRDLKLHFKMSFQALVFGGLGLRVQIYPELCLGRGVAVLGTVDHASLRVSGNRSLTCLTKHHPSEPRKGTPPLVLGLGFPETPMPISLN